MKEPKKKKKPEYLYLCTTKCRYVVIRKAAKMLGYKLTDDETGEWDLYWSDITSVTPE